MKTNNILLIRPPYHFDSENKYDLPLGLLYIAAALEKNGYSVELLDGALREKPEEFWDILPSYLSGVKYVGITIPYTFQYPNARRTAGIIKAKNPDIRVIVGGPDVSVRYKEILESESNIDVAVIGEGEETTTELIKALDGNKVLSSIKGIAYRENGKVNVPPPRAFIRELDSIPFPAYHLANMDLYFKMNALHPTRTYFKQKPDSRGITMITSRGCPFNCNFCSIHLHMGRLWRYHSKDYVIEHMEYLIKNYGVDEFHFEDDNISANVKRFEAILDTIVSKHWNIIWDVPNGMRADTLNREVIRKMIQSGCSNAIIGVESGVQKTLDNIVHKNLNLKTVVEIAKIAKQEKLHLRGFYIIGFPGETRKDIKQSLRFAVRMYDKYDFNGGFAFAVPLYGTELFEICKKQNLFIREPTPENLSKAYKNEGIIKTVDFAPPFLNKMLKRYEYVMKWLKLKKFVTNFLFDGHLRRYFLRKLKENPQGWRQYISDIVYWKYLIK